MKTKQIVALLMAAVMTVSFAACGEKKENESDNVQQEADEDKESESADDQAEEENNEAEGVADEGGFVKEGDVPETMFEEPLTIDFALWDVTDFDPESNPYLKYLATKFNVDFEIRTLDWGNYEEQLASWGAADDMPDFLRGRIDEAYYGDFIDQELIRDIPLEMLEKYPIAYQRWLDDPLQQALYEYYGVIYYINCDDGRDNDYTGSYTGGQGMYYRKDWADKLGYDAPTNMDEYLDLLIAFAKEDPDGNGADDTYGLATSFGRLEGLWSWFNCFPDYWVETEEGYVPGYLDKENMLDGLTWLRKAYENGAVDPEWQGDIQGFVDDKFGAYSYHCDPGWATGIICKQFGATHEGNPYDLVDAFSSLPAHEGEEATSRPYYVDTLNSFSYDCPDEIVERMLAIYEWICSEEGWMFAQYGFEGTDYTVDEATGKVNVIPDNPRSKVQNLGIMHFNTWGGSHTDLRYINYTDNDAVEQYGVTDESSFEFGRKMVEATNAAALNEDVTFALVPSVIQTPEKASFLFDHRQGLLDIVIGTDDVETMYDAFVESAYSAGAQSAIDSINNAMNK